MSLASLQSRLRWLPYTVAGAATFFALWTLLPQIGLVSSSLLPSPFVVGKTFFDLTHEPFAGYTIQQHLLSSFGRYAMGFGLAAAIGIPLGLLMGWYGWLDRAVSPIVHTTRFIAPIAWLPFAVLWFGTGIGGPILIIFSGAFPACLINAYRGAKLTQSSLVEAALTLGARPRHVIAEVLLPSALPSIVAGLRIGAGVGWQSLIGAELIVVSSGVGYLMVQSQSNLATEKVMAGMAAIGCVGVLIDVALRAAERRFRRFEQS